MTTDNAKIKAYRARAVQFGLDGGFNLEQAEDFAQRYIMNKFVRGKKQCLEHCYVDFLRYELGDPRSTTHGIRKKQVPLPYEYREPVPTPLDILLKRERVVHNLKAFDFKDRVFIRRLLTLPRRAVAKKYSVGVDRISQKLALLRDKFKVYKCKCSSS